METDCPLENHLPDYRGCRAMSWGDWFWQLLFADWSLADIAEGYGLTEHEVKKAIGPALFADHQRQTIAEIDEPAEIWCPQCESRVSASFADRCSSRFCKAKAVAA